MTLCCVQECRLLLLSLTLVSLLPATPELAIRSTVSLSPEHSVGSIQPRVLRYILHESSRMLQVCILTTSPLTYALYVTFKLILRHVLPAILILLCILRPRSASPCISLLDIRISLHLSTGRWWPSASP